MRKCRQVEIRKLTTAFNNSVRGRACRRRSADRSALLLCDPKADGAMRFGHLMQAFIEMGYEPDADATWEAAKIVGVPSKEANLDISDFWQVLTECRARQWFPSVELNQISQAFEQFDLKGNGEIGIVQIDSALITMGLSLTWQMLTFLVGKVDLDRNGLLNQIEFRKLIRMFQSERSQLARETFEDFADEDSGSLSVSDSLQAFATLGLETDNVENIISVETANKTRWTDALDKEDFLTAVRKFEKEQQLFRQKSCGFSEQAVNDLAERFQHFDKNGSGLITGREIHTIIEEFLPSVATSPLNRPRLMKMMEEAQGRAGALTEGDTSPASSKAPKVELSFPQLLKLLSLARAFKLEQLHDEEQRVIEKCDLALHEVQNFREVFLHSASGDGYMTMKDVWSLFHKICPLGDRNRAEIREHIRDVKGNEWHSNVSEVSSKGASGALQGFIRKRLITTPSNHDMTITFAELMMLMGRLRDANFGGIRDKFFS
jgi:Ca2+-binding EF-hand superfamily protein